MGRSMPRRVIGQPPVLFFGLLLLSTSGLIGCQATWFSTGVDRSIENARFMALWHTYMHCHSSSDSSAMEADARQLDQAAQDIRARNAPTFALPRFLQPLVSELPSRLAADPTAMAAACALAAADAARAAGRIYLAAQLLRFIMRTVPEPPYAYYVAQARLGLDRIQSTLSITIGVSQQTGVIPRATP